MNWKDAKEQRDEAGNLTDLALALDALENNGCDCGTDEPGTCLACICEAALKSLMTQQDTLRERIKVLEESINALWFEGGRT